MSSSAQATRSIGSPCSRLPRSSRTSLKDLPREALLDAADRHAPALLVPGRNGLGGLKERLLGSTTAALLARAPCPVLVEPK
jgi:nucleotide-binding universal stress UspA family protein